MMRKIFFIPLILLIGFLNSGYTAKGTYCPTDPSRPHIAGVETIVSGYLEAVDRGELRSFNRELGRSEIVPVRVEYVYEIASGTMEINVYSNLKDHMPVPNQPGARVHSVNSIIEDGKIVETESHVWIE